MHRNSLKGFCPWLSKPRGSARRKSAAGRPFIVTVDMRRAHDNTSALPSFYVYEHPALDHSWMRARCGSRLNALLMSAHGRLAAEVGLHLNLRDHPRRTRDPESAQLFYIPIYEYVSFKLDSLCEFSSGGELVLGQRMRLSNHKERMEVAFATLLASPHWRRSGGNDHIFASTAYNHPSHMSDRMLPLSKALRCSITGRYRQFEFGDKRTKHSSGGICSITLPYVSPQHATLAESARKHAAAQEAAESARKYARAAAAPQQAAHYGVSSRPIFLYFAGSLDVCCYGRDVRCMVGDLMVDAANDSSVLIRPQVPRAEHKDHRGDLGGRCYTFHDLP